MSILRTVEDTKEAPVGSARAVGAIPFRAWLLLLLGLPLTLLSFVLVVGIEDTLQIGLPTGVAIYYHVVILFSLLIFLNAALSRASQGRFYCSRPEMLCLYAMMNIGGCFASWESLVTVVPALAYPAYTVANRSDATWLKPVIANLPNWAIVKDPMGAQAIFHGGVWARIWPSWAEPLLAWGTILGILFLMFLALTRLLWDSWTHHEHLTFPLTALPLQMTDRSAPVWRSRLFWGAFALASAFDLIVGLHSIFPGVPTINVKVQFINAAAADPALQAVGAVPLTFHPLMIGIGLLLRTDLLFSIWFFYLVGLAQTYAAGFLGTFHGSKYVFLDNSPGLLAQNFGAIVVLGGTLIWRARPAISARFLAARKGDRGALADFGVLIGGALLLTAALCQLGLTVGLAALTILIILLLAIFVCRLRAELGLPVHNLQFMGPDGPLTALFSGNGLTQHTQSGFSALFAVTRSQQGDPMPFLMESAYMTDRIQGPVHRIWGILGFTGVLTAFIGPWIVLRMLSARGLETLGYNEGVSSGGWMVVRAFLLGQHLPDYGAIGHMAGGALVTLLLIGLQQVWMTSPFHPVGYAISGSWGTGMVWTPFLIAWACKSLAVRYGGAKAVRSILPLALGLIMGEFTAGMFWTTLSYATGAQCYRIWLF